MKRSSLLRSFVRAFMPTLLVILLLSGRAACAQVVTSNLTANQVTLGLTSSTTGTGSFVLLSGSATCGTAAQTVAGQDSSGTASYRWGSLPLTAAVPANYTIHNLVAGTTYTVCATPDGTTAPSQISITTKAATSLATHTWQAVGMSAFSTREADYTSLAFAPDGTPYVAFQDGGGTGPAKVVKFDTANGWQMVGGAVSTGQATYTSLAFSPDGTPYVAFADYSVSAAGKATVVKYDSQSGTWLTVGTPGFSADAANGIALAFGPDGTPYVAASLTSQRSQLYGFNTVGGWQPVFGFLSGSEANGTSVAVGPDGSIYMGLYLPNLGRGELLRFKSPNLLTGFINFPSFSGGNISLAIAPDGTLYAAYMDGSSTPVGKATVLRLNGTTWQSIGDAGLSTGTVNFLSLAFAADSTPYLAYQDSSGGPATVMKFDGANWQPLGTADFSSGAARYTSLAVAPDGTPYVAYQDGLNGPATVMSLQPALPTISTGTATNLTASSAILNGTVNDNGSATAVSFDYGMSTSYGTNVAATTPASGSVAAGSGNTTVSVALKGLLPGTTYHFRVNGTSNGKTVSGSDATFTTGAATSVITASSATAVANTASVSMSATIAYTGSIAPTGAVVFTVNKVGTAASCTNTASTLTCTATVPTASLAAAAYPVTVTEAADAYYVAATGTATLTITALPPADFTFTPSGTSTQTVVAGSSATYSFTLTPSSAAGTFNFSATGLPPGATATFTPNSITSNGTTQTVTLTIQTVKSTTASVAHPESGPWPRVPLTAIAAMLLPILFRRRMRDAIGTRLATMILLLSGLGALAGLAGCGSSSTFPGQPSTNYTVTVTATNGVATHTYNVTLTLQ